MTLIAPGPAGVSGAGSLFPFVEGAHPFAGAIGRFREELANRTQAADWLADEDTIVHTEIKGGARAGGEFAIDRMYCSLQRAGDGFEALSLCFSAKHGRTDWYAFPDEPYLAGLRAFVEGDALVAAGDEPLFDVLRYVPLRRFTFRGRLRTRPDRRVIGKFKRASRVHVAQERAVAIERAVTAAGRPFTVAAPLGVDAAHGICFQGEVPGTPLSELIADEAGRAAGLAEAGALQHAFHALPARDLPVWDQEAFVRGILRDVDWIAFLRPDAEPVLEGARRALAAPPAPVSPGDLACCHGDFVCSHLYRSSSGWAVIDLDLAQRADPLWELAMALAALARDVPALEAARSDPATDAAAVLQRAEDAYLGGYRAASGPPVDRRRLGYWRLCSEIYELALMLTKNRYEPVAFTRALSRVGELAHFVMEDETT